MLPGVPVRAERQVVQEDRRAHEGIVQQFRAKAAPGADGPVSRGVGLMVVVTEQQQRQAQLQRGTTALVDTLVKQLMAVQPVRQPGLELQQRPVGLLYRPFLVLAQGAFQFHRVGEKYAVTATR